MAISDFTPSDIDRFWSKVSIPEDSGKCWLWTACTSSYGYGILRINGRNHGAHRVSYELNVAPIPKGYDCCHHCDNPLCVNPSHLFAGTRKDNLNDMRAKGRAVYQANPEKLARGDRNGARTHPEKILRGENNGKAKLTNDQVRDIRRRVNAGEKQNALAIEFGVLKSTINSIIKRRNWKNIE